MQDDINMEKCFEEVHEPFALLGWDLFHLVEMSKAL